MRDVSWLCVVKWGICTEDVAVLAGGNSVRSRRLGSGGACRRLRMRARFRPGDGVGPPERGRPRVRASPFRASGPSGSRPEARVFRPFLAVIRKTFGIFADPLARRVRIVVYYAPVAANGAWRPRRDVGP